MAFSPRTWLDRLTEFPNRRTLTKSDGGNEVVTVARNEGTVTEEGTPLNAANMNDLEQRIASANQELLGDFATVETGTTASKPYTIGELLSTNGLLYKVTAAISTGNALVVNGNIKKTTVGEEIAALNNDLEKYKIIVGTGATMSNKLDSLFNAYNGLTNAQKIKSKMLINNNALGCINITDRMFSTSYISPSYLSPTTLTALLKAGGSRYYMFENNTYTDGGAITTLSVSLVIVN